MTKARVRPAARLELFPGGSQALRGKRMLLLYPPVRLSRPPLYPPFGLLSIAAVLEEAGMTVEILDLNLERMRFDDVRRELAGRHFDAVGIGGMTTVYYYMKLLSLQLKKMFPDVPVIGGGSACSASPRLVLEKTGIDVACVGEGEPVIVDLVSRLLAEKRPDLSDIPGIWYLDASGAPRETEGRPRMANITDLPLPAYHLIDMEPYIRNAAVFKHGTLPLIEERIAQHGIDRERAMRPVALFSKRGCPFGCNFCYRNFGRKVVYSDVDYVLDHMSFLEEKYDTAHFVFGDEIFNTSKDWVLEFCDRLIAEDRHYVIGTFNGLRANVLDREMLEKMKAAGFCSIGIGIESFHDPTLKAMQKGQKAAQIFEAIRTAREVGFHINSAQLLFGYETDSRESMEVNLAALRELGMYSAGFAIPCPYPGTALYDIALERGLIGDEEAWLFELADKDISDRVVNLSVLPDRELVRLARYGEDSAVLAHVRKRHPVLGLGLQGLTRAGRLVGFDTIGAIRRSLETLRYLRREGRLPERGASRDEQIREEAFELLARWGELPARAGLT